MRTISYILAICCLIIQSSCFWNEYDPGRVYEIRGVDVSRYQGVVDWEALADDDHTFTFIKASQGDYLKDPLFDHNWEAAGNAGFIRGAYHYFSPHISAEKQFESYAKYVILKPGDLPPVLDVEEMGSLDAHQLNMAVTKWMQLAEAKYGVKPILYAGQNFYNQYLAGRYNGYPLWLARYDPRAPVTVCNRTYQFWQYTDRGELPGVQGYIDRNVFLGTKSDFSLLCIPPLYPQADDLAR